jgi:hypothetical protein
MLTSDWKGVTGPANVVRRRFRNIEAQAASIAGHEQIYAQLTPGLFDGGLESYAISERTAFFVETTNRSIRKRFQVLPGHLRVGFLLGEFTCWLSATRALISHRPHSICTLAKTIEAVG